jgi:hypothetical protein
MWDKNDVLLSAAGAGHIVFIILSYTPMVQIVNQTADYPRQDI